MIEDLDNDTSPPPQNNDLIFDTNELDELEYDLPESEAFPPDEMQARLEMPSTYISTTDASGNEVLAMLDAVTEVGVEPVWSETDEMLNWTEDSSFATVDINGGQLDISGSDENSADEREL